MRLIVFRNNMCALLENETTFVTWLASVYPYSVLIESLSIGSTDEQRYYLTLQTP